MCVRKNVPAYFKDACFLKYGTGERVSLKSKIGEGPSFGHKYSSGK